MKEEGLEIPWCGPDGWKSRHHPAPRHRLSPSLAHRRPGGGGGDGGGSGVRPGRGVAHGCSGFRPAWASCGGWVASMLLAACRLLKGSESVRHCGVRPCCLPCVCCVCCGCGKGVVREMCPSKRGPQAPTEKAKEAARLNTPHNVHMNQGKQKRKSDGQGKARQGQFWCLLVLFLVVLVA